MTGGDISGISKTMRQFSLQQIIVQLQILLLHIMSPSLCLTTFKATGTSSNIRHFVPNFGIANEDSLNLCLVDMEPKWKKEEILAVFGSEVNLKGIT
jgi:hypothetical protein